MNNFLIRFIRFLLSSDLTVRQKRQRLRLRLGQRKLAKQRDDFKVIINKINLAAIKQKELVGQKQALEKVRRKVRDLRAQREVLQAEIKNQELEVKRQMAVETSLERDVILGLNKGPMKSFVKLFSRQGKLNSSDDEGNTDPRADEPENIDLAVKNRVHNIDQRLSVVQKQTAFIKAELLRFPNTKENYQRFAAKINGRLDVLNKNLGNVGQQTNAIRNRVEALARAAARKSKTGPAWACADRLSLTDNWEPLSEKPQSPFVMRKRGRIDVLFLNSMGGSMSRLSKGLMLHENIVSDCMISAYYPRRHLVYPHETNVFGVFQHQEWRDYMEWAVGHFDIVQTTSFPLWPGVAECYDWLTDTLGRRHIWRTTGFIHHYLLREDIISLERYQKDLKTENVPAPDRLATKTFKVKDQHFLTDPNVVFYSSPEKGAYLKGKDTYWLPSIRDDEAYAPNAKYQPPKADQTVKIYVPHHENAVFKGLDKAIEVLEELQKEGYKIQIVTPENATDLWPDLRGFKDGNEEAAKAAVYPVPNHLMPVLFSRVDLVIDQIVMGCYGNTGIEAMMSGKPVLGQKKFNEVKDCPVIDVTGDTMKGEILKLLENRSTWKSIGEAGREYALKVHSSQAVSKIAADTYRMILDENKN